MSEPQPLYVPGPADETPPGGHRHRELRTLVEWAAVVLVALLAAFLVKTFLFQPFYIPSESMVPTLEVDDRLLVNKLSYKLHDVHRGDIVVFERPPGQLADSAIKDLVKRVMALPGETVEGKDGRVFVNGEPVDEPYLPDGTSTSAFAPVTLGDHQVWVMGDNRSFSSDSRSFGPIDEDLIEGRAFLRFWPLGNLGLL